MQDPEILYVSDAKDFVIMKDSHGDLYVCHFCTFEVSRFHGDYLSDVKNKLEEIKDLRNEIEREARGLLR